MASASRRLAVVAAALLALSACAAPPKKSGTRKSGSRPPATATRPADASKAPTTRSNIRAAKPEPRTTTTAQKPAPGKAPAAATAPSTPAPPPAFRTGPQAPAQTAAAAPATVSPKERYEQALEALKSNQFQAAETALLAATRDYANYSGPHTNLGIVYARTNRKAQARAAFERAVAIDKDNAIALNWLGVLAREAGSHAAAERYYRAALEADSGYAPAQLNLGILYDQYLKRPADALAAYRRYAAMTDDEDLRTAVWIAELEARLPKAPAPAAAPPPRRPGASS
jgi:tetratricopeptide (TPR) repeat protein